MNRNTSLGFVSDLRRLLEVSTGIVWDSEEISRSDLGDWPEEAFFNALIVEGLLGRSSQTKEIRSRLRNGNPFSIDFDYTVHSHQTMEPLTGADLAIVVSISIDGETVHRKLILVQLKRAKISNGRVCFPELHYKSGSSYYGEDIHQAQKMLLFSPASVYWLCVPSHTLTDNIFLKTYSEFHNLAQRSQHRDTGSLLLSVPTPWPSLFTFTVLEQPSVFLEFVDEYYPFYYFLKRYLRKVSQDPERVIEKWIEEWSEKYKMEQRVNLLRSLQHDARLEAWRAGNLCSRFSVIVVHATSVLALAADGRTDLKTIIGMSTSLPQFILGNVISDGFGDDDQNVLESLTKKTPDEYIRSKVQTYARRKTEIEGTIPVRAVVQVRMTLHTHFEKERG